jgi:YHS domain-containing protein
MRVDEWTAAISADFNGEKWVFCSKHCLQRFQANPEKYITVQPLKQEYKV